MALIVLGYTLNPDQSLHPVLKTRLDKCLEVYKPGLQIIVCGKGKPKAFLERDSAEKTEAEAMHSYLLDKGIPKECILHRERIYEHFDKCILFLHQLCL